MMSRVTLPDRPILEHASTPRQVRRIMMTADAVGGVWRYALDLARALSVHDVSTLLVGLGPSPSAAQVDEASRIVGLDVHWTGLPLDWLAQSESEGRQVSAALAEVAIQHEIQLVQFNVPSQRAFVPLTIPSVVVSHSCLSTWWRAMKPGEPLPDSWRWIHDHVADGLCRADSVVAPSSSHARAVTACYGSSLPVRVVLNGSSLSGPAVNKDDLVFSAGRWWDDAKNLEMLDEAAATCHWPVHAAGSLEGHGGCARQVRHVNAIGDLDRAAMAQWFARAEIFVSPSLYEPFGLAVLEAARASCALVLSDIPTFRELWDGAAVFVDPHSARSISAAINDLAEHPVRRGEFAKAARCRAQQYTASAQADAMLRIYRELVETASQPAWRV